MRRDVKKGLGRDLKVLKEASTALILPNGCASSHGRQTCYLVLLSRLASSPRRPFSSKRLRRQYSWLSGKQTRNLQILDRDHASSSHDLAASESTLRHTTRVFTK